MARPRRVNPIVLDDLQVVDRNKLLTMPLNELDALLERQEAIYREKEEEERKYKETRKIEFFEPLRKVFCECGSEMVFDWNGWTIKPNEPGWNCLECHKVSYEEPPYQVKALEYIHAGKTVVSLSGANGIGKTLLGAIVTGSACLGIQPWDRKETRWGRNPVRCRILCSDWEKHAKEVIVPKLKEWFPKGEYETSKNNLGIESNFKFKNGSNIELITNKQSTSDHEGWEGDVVWGDETFSREKFVANLRGLRKGNGLFLITFTHIAEPWMLDDLLLNTDQAYASIQKISIKANPYITKEYIRTFSASLRESEKIARIEGGSYNLIGLVWPGFVPDTHIIDDFKIPTDWPVVPLIDWHTNKPIAVGFYAVDQRDFRYVIDEIWKNGSAEEIGDEIIRRKKLDAWRIEEAFIDPLSKGDTANVKNMGIEIKDTFNRLKEKLWKEGIELKVATKDKDSGIRNIEDMLKGLNGMPSLFFFRSLVNKIKDEGHIWEIQRWTYGDDGKPKDENDHFMENLYRMTLTGIKYSKLITGSRTTDISFDVFEPNYGIKETESEFSVFG